MLIDRAGDVTFIQDLPTTFIPDFSEERKTRQKIDNNNVKSEGD
jgi:hypothetical protein